MTTESPQRIVARELLAKLKKVYDYDRFFRVQFHQIKNFLMHSVPATMKGLKANRFSIPNTNSKRIRIILRFLQQMPFGIL